MNPNLKAHIRNLLEQHTAIAQTEHTAPHDYASLRECMLQLELKQECQVLQTLLDSENFEEQFKQRCHHRESDLLSTLAIKDIPESITNQLYWKIAQEVFQPNNLLEMLAILLPSLKSVIDIDLYQPLKPVREFGHRKAEDILKPVIKITSNLESLKLLPAQLIHLTHCVIENNELLALEELSHYPLSIQAKLKSELRKRRPALATKLYTHNPEFKVLDQDILILQSRGISPKIAIENLIQGLTFGGTMITGSDFATQSAEETVKIFIEYYNSLDADFQNKLRAIASGNLSIGIIIDEEIEKGTCVETTAKHFNIILQEHAENPYLNMMSAMSPDEVKALKAKHPNKAIDLVKDPNAKPVFPLELTERALKTILVKTTEELILLLLNFPAAMYDLFFLNVTLFEPKNRISELFMIMQQGLFNSVQIQALAKTLIKNYSRFNISEKLIQLASRTGNHELLNEYLSSIPAENRAELVSENNIEGYNAVHLAGKNVQTLKVILDLIPIQERLAVILKKNKDGNNVLHYDPENSECTKVILESLPAEQRLQVVLEYYCGYNHVHIALAFLPTLKMMLELIPENQRLAAVSGKGRDGESALIFAASKSELRQEKILMILEKLPAQDRVAALLLQDMWGHTLFRYITRTASEFQAILNVLTEAQRLELFLKLNDDGKSLFELIKRHPNSLKVGLDSLTPIQIAAICEQQNATGSHLLHQMADDTDTLKRILACLPDDQKMRAIAKKNEQGETPLLSAANSLSSLQVILDCYDTPQKKLAAIKQVNKKGNSLLHLVAMIPDALVFILNHYPASEKIAAVNQVNIDNASVLHFAATKPESLQALLALCSEPQKWTVLLKMDSEGDTLLHKIAEGNGPLVSLLTSLPMHRRLAVMYSVNRWGETVLHKLPRKSKQLPELLQLIDADDRLALLNELDVNGRSVMHNLMSAGQAANLKTVIELIPMHQRVVLFSQNNLLHLSLRKFEMLQTLFAFYSDQARSAALTQTDQSGNTLLHNAIYDHNCFKFILEQYPPDQRAQALTKTNHSGNAPLHESCYDTKCWQVIKELIPEEQRLAVVLTKNSSGMSCLARVATDDEKVHAIISVLPEAQRAGAVSENTLLHLCRPSVSRVKMLLSLIPKAQHLALIKQVDSNGNTLLHEFTFDVNSVQIILNYYPDNEMASALLQENKQGLTPLHLACQAYPKTFQRMLTYLTPEQIKSIIAKKDHEGQTLLHLISSVEIMETLLGFYSDEQKQALLLQKDNHGQSVLMTLSLRSLQPQLALKFIPENQRLAAVTNENQPCESLLNICARNVDLLRGLLATLTDEQRMAAVKVRNGDNRTVLHQSPSPEALKLLLGCYPKHQRLDALKQKDNAGRSVTSYNPECLQEILEYYPVADRLAVVSLVTENGNTLMHDLVRTGCIDSASYLCGIFTPTQIFELCERENDNGETPFHVAQSASGILQIVIKNYSKEQRFSAVMRTNKQNETILHKAPSSYLIEIVFKDFTDQQKIAALACVNKKGQTALHILAENQCWDKIFKYLPSGDSLLPVLTSCDQDGNSVLHLIRDGDSLIAALNFYQNDKKVPALLQLNNKGQSVLSQIINMRTLKDILINLPDEQRLALLKSKVGAKSFLEILCQSNEKFLSSEFKDSYIPRLIEVYRDILSKEKRNNKNIGFFYTTSPETLWKRRLDACSTTEEMQECLQQGLMESKSLLFYGGCLK